MNTIGSTCNTLATRTPKRSAKRVVLAGRFALAAKTADHFRKLGWEVHTLTADHDVHAAAAETEPHAILLQEEAGDESGYLACAKLRSAQPCLKVVVIGSVRTGRRERLAKFVGAEFVTEAEGVNRLVAAVSC
jgi:DNA-binding response OmpR family regulator